MINQNFDSVRDADKAAAVAVNLGVPDVRDLYSDCGSFAGALYGGRCHTYMRQTKKGTERVVSMNGFIVEHNETDCITDALVETSTPCLLGSWVWGLGLKSRLGFHLVSSCSLAEGLLMRVVK